MFIRSEISSIRLYCGVIMSPT